MWLYVCMSTMCMQMLMEVTRVWNAQNCSCGWSWAIMWVPEVQPGFLQQQQVLFTTEHLSTTTATPRLSWLSRSYISTTTTPRLSWLSWIFCDTESQAVQADCEFLVFLPLLSNCWENRYAFYPSPIKFTGPNRIFILKIYNIFNHP